MRSVVDRNFVMLPMTVIGDGGGGAAAADDDDGDDHNDDNIK